MRRSIFSGIAGLTLLVSVGTGIIAQAAVKQIDSLKRVLYTHSQISAINKASKTFKVTAPYLPTKLVTGDSFQRADGFYKTISLTYKYLRIYESSVPIVLGGWGTGKPIKLPIGMDAHWERPTMAANVNNSNILEFELGKTYIALLASNKWVSRTDMKQLAESMGLITNVTNSPSDGSQKANDVSVSQTAHGLKQGESLIGGNPVAPAFIPALPKSRYRTLIPTALIRVEYAVTAPKPPKLPATVKMSLPKSLAHDLTAYYFPLYGHTGFYVLGLKGMKATAQVGADGSYNVTLKNASGTEIDLSSSGGCQGCTVDAAALYFPSARKDASEYGGYHGTYLEDLPVHIENLNSAIKLWAYKEKNNKQLVGFVHYKSTNNGEDTFMNEVFVGSNTDVKKIAPWLLQNTLLQFHIEF